MTMRDFLLPAVPLPFDLPAISGLEVTSRPYLEVNIPEGRSSSSGDRVENIGRNFSRLRLGQGVVTVTYLVGDLTRDTASALLGASVTGSYYDNGRRNRVAVAGTTSGPTQTVTDTDGLTVNSMGMVEPWTYSRTQVFHNDISTSHQLPHQPYTVTPGCRNAGMVSILNWDCRGPIIF